MERMKTVDMKAIIILLFTIVTLLEFGTVVVAERGISAANNGKVIRDTRDRKDNTNQHITTLENYRVLKESTAETLAKNPKGSQPSAPKASPPQQKGPSSADTEEEEPEEKEPEEKEPEEEEPEEEVPEGEEPEESDPNDSEPGGLTPLLGFIMNRVISPLFNLFRRLFRRDGTVDSSAISVPSISPSTLSDAPSIVPISSDLPSLIPSDVPSLIPSDVPSLLPSDVPSLIPSDVPSLMPSDSPSLIPSDVPSITPSHVPSLLLNVTENTTTEKEPLDTTITDKEPVSSSLEQASSNIELEKGSKFGIGFAAAGVFGLSIFYIIATKYRHRTNAAAIEMNPTDLGIDEELLTPNTGHSNMMRERNNNNTNNNAGRQQLNLSVL
jgi:hypothetical protein